MKFILSTIFFFTIVLSLMPQSKDEINYLLNEMVANSLSNGLRLVGAGLACISICGSGMGIGILFGLFFASFEYLTGFSH